MSYSNYYTTSGLFHGAFPSIMGTQFDLLMLGRDPKLLDELWSAIESELIRLDKMLNRFDPASEVSLVNRTAFLHPVEVTDELWTILQDCKQCFEWTEGLFDITVDDFNLVKLDDNHGVSFLEEKIQLDFGGYGKGYALGRIQPMLREKGIQQALVNFGNSSILAVGTHPYGDYWPVGLDNPYTHQRMVDLQLKDTVLSTSGNMPSHPKHIIDPSTGAFVDERKMVSVVAENPVVTEVLTTAFMIADEAQRQRIATRFKINEDNIYMYQL